MGKHGNTAIKEVESHADTRMSNHRFPPFCSFSTNINFVKKKCRIVVCRIKNVRNILLMISRKQKEGTIVWRINKPTLSVASLHIGHILLWQVVGEIGNCRLLSIRQAQQHPANPQANTP